MKRNRVEDIPEMRKAGGILRLHRAALCVDCEHISRSERRPLPAMRIRIPAQSRSGIEPEGGRVNTRASRGPVGIDQASRHNPRAGASAQGGCAEAGMQGLLSLNDVATRASMSTRFIRKHLSEIPHYRASARGKIWIDWSEFQSWVRKLRVEIRQDDPVVEILRDLARKRSGAA